MFEDLKNLLDSEMFEDAKNLGGFYLSILDNGGENYGLPDTIKLYYYLANAHYQTHEHRKAENLYSKAVDLIKRLGRSTTARHRNQEGVTPDYGDLPTDADIKWSMYQCHMQLRTYKDGQAVLESIPPRKRTAKVNMALGNLYMRYGNDRGAVSCFKEVLKEMPFSLEASRHLLQLGVAATEVQEATQMVQIGSQVRQELMPAWVNAHLQSYARNYTASVQEFERLDSTTFLRGNLSLLASMGETQYLAGDYMGAERTLGRLHALDRQWLRHMDIYSDLLQRHGKLGELDKVALKLLHVTEHRSEPWIAFAYSCYASGKIPRSLYFAQKAFMLNGSCLHSLLLKGYGLLKSSKVAEATTHFVEARRLAPYNFEAWKGVVECYVAEKKYREASNKAQEVVKLVGQSARTLTLLGRTLWNEEGTREKARTCLEKAHRLEPERLETVFQLADVYMKMGKYERGIMLLNSQLTIEKTVRLHEKLGEFLEKVGERKDALEQFQKALSLDPTNDRVKDRVTRLEEDDIAVNSLYEEEDPEDVTDPDWSD